MSRYDTVEQQQQQGAGDHNDDDHDDHLQQQQQQHVHTATSPITTTTTAANIPLKHRVLCAALMAVSSMSSQLSIDVLTAEADAVVDYLSLGSAAFGVLAAVVAVPGIVAGFTLGPVLDRFGVYPAAMTLGITLVIALATQAIGVALLSPTLLGVGRFMSGGTYMCLLVVYNSLLASWFTVREQPLVYAVYLTSIRIGSLIVYLLGSQATQRLGLVSSLVGVTGITAIGGAFLCAAIGMANRLLHGGPRRLPLPKAPKVEVRLVWAAMRKAGPVAIIVAAMWGTEMAMSSVIKAYLISEWPGVAPQVAGSWLAGAYLVTIVVMLCCGEVVRRHGQRAWFAAAGMIIQSLGMWLLAFQVNAVVGLAAIGVGIAVGPAGVWPALGVLVSPKTSRDDHHATHVQLRDDDTFNGDARLPLQAGGGDNGDAEEEQEEEQGEEENNDSLVATGFGAVFSTESMAIFVMVLASGAITERFGSASYALGFQGLCVTAGALFAVAWAAHDTWTAGPLNRSPSKL